MDVSYWQDAQGRVYKVTEYDESAERVQGLTRITRATYRRMLRSHKRSPVVLDAPAVGESADEVSE